MSRDAKKRKELRRRDRDFQFKRATRGYLTPSAPMPPNGAFVNLRHIEYSISFDPLEESEDISGIPELRRAIGEEAVDRLREAAMENPVAAVHRLRRLTERYPRIPVLLNWMGAAYESIGQKGKAFDIALESFKRFPDYLYAKVGMCSVLLLGGEIEQVTRILDKKFNLKLMYPHRNVFHVHEEMALQHLLVSYFMALGDADQARVSLDLMKKLLPEHRLTRSALARVKSAPANTRRSGRTAAV